MNQDPLTYRHPRTMNEAFGPQLNDVIEEDEEYNYAEVIVYAVCIFGLAWLALILIVWG